MTVHSNTCLRNEFSEFEFPLKSMGMQFPLILVCYSFKKPVCTLSSELTAVEALQVEKQVG